MSSRRINPNSHRLAVILALAFGLAGGACRSRDDATTTRRDVPLLGVDLGVEDLRIDGYEAEFAWVHWLGVSPAGRIALLEQQDRTVKFYDASGRLLG